VSPKWRAIDLAFWSVMALWEHHCLRNRFLVASQFVRDLLFCAKYLFVAARVRSMDKLLFWLGLGAAQKGAGPKALDRRNRTLSFAVGTLLALKDLFIEAEEGQLAPLHFWLTTRINIPTAINPGGCGVRRLPEYLAH
jgi:hypothetical protein